VALAKVLRDFTKENPALTFKQAYLEGQVLDSDSARQIAEMPTREELLTKLGNREQPQGGFERWPRLSR